MSVFPGPLQVREAHFGFAVSGGPKTLPASTQGHIFTVSGGRVVLTSLIGLVTTAIQNQACTLSLGNTPSGGSAFAASIATATSIINLAVGVSMGVGANSGLALIVGNGSGVLSGNGANDALGTTIINGGICLVPAGTIDMTTSATNTGAIQWSLTYIPFDVGATVTAL